MMIPGDHPQGLDMILVLGNASRGWTWGTASPIGSGVDPWGQALLCAPHKHGHYCIGPKTDPPSLGIPPWGWASLSKGALNLGAEHDSAGLGIAPHTQGAEGCPGTSL